MQPPRGRRSGRLYGLAVLGPAADVENDLFQGDAHGNFHEPRVLDLPTREKICPLALRVPMEENQPLPF